MTAETAMTTDFLSLLDAMIEEIGNGQATSPAHPVQNQDIRGARARDYMGNAVRDIDGLFGDGYAEEHPELIGAYMRTAAADFGAAIVAKESHKGLEEIACALDDISDSIDKLSTATEALAENVRGCRAAATDRRASQELNKCKMKDTVVNTLNFDTNSNIYWRA